MSPRSTWNFSSQIFFFNVMVFLHELTLMIKDNTKLVSDGYFYVGIISYVHRGFLKFSICRALGSISSNKMGQYFLNSASRGIITCLIWGWASRVVRMIKI